uniref:HD domain-containing protein n=1 Tax=Agathobacter sp. TaxID=2021311 RepID=UPI0040578F64
MNTLLDEETLYVYVETYAKQNQLHQTSRVLPYARKMHKGQYRKGKEKIPYICHPLLVAYHALVLGLDEDNLVSAALLHDVCEDCGIAVQDLPVNEETKHIVALLTKADTPEAKTEEGKAAYYAAIAGNGSAVMIKLLDRCNNVSGMTQGFGKEKMAWYCKETEKWFYPLIENAKNDYPMYADQIFLIEYHMLSVLEAIKHQL